MEVRSYFSTDSAMEVRSYFSTDSAMEVQAMEIRLYFSTDSFSNGGACNGKHKIAVLKPCRKSCRIIGVPNFKPVPVLVPVTDTVLAP